MGRLGPEQGSWRHLGFKKVTKVTELLKKVKKMTESVQLFKRNMAKAGPDTTSKYPQLLLTSGLSGACPVQLTPGRHPAIRPGVSLPPSATSLVALPPAHTVSCMYPAVPCCTRLVYTGQGSPGGVPRRCTQAGLPGPGTPPYPVLHYPGPAPPCPYYPVLCTPLRRMPLQRLHQPLQLVAGVQE